MTVSLRAGWYGVSGNDTVNVAIFAITQVQSSILEDRAKSAFAGQNSIEI